MNPIRFHSSSDKGSMAAGLALAAVIVALAVPQAAHAGDTRRGARTNVNVNNKNVNVNSNRHVDIDVDNHHHPVGTALAIGATVAVTAAVVGSVTPTLPPACVPIIVNGLMYQQCGTAWYQPQYVGSSVQYVVVAPLR